jgi:hypothetical protein
MPFVIEDDEGQAQTPKRSGGRFVIEEPEKKASEYGRATQEALGVAKGASDPFVGASQLVMRGLNKLGVVSDEALKTHEGFYNNLEQKYQEATPEGSGIGRVVGNLAVPMPIKGLGVGAGVLNTLARGAQQGAIAGALQPVDTSGGEDFATEKAKQIALGAGLGGALPAVANVGKKALSPVFEKFVKEPISEAVASGVERGNAPLVAKAQALVEQKFPGVDWQAVPGDVRQQLTKMAEDSSSFQAMTPEALARAAEMKALPVPIEGTKGQLTKDFMQNQFERETAKTGPGAALREMTNKQNAQIYENFDSFVDQTGGRLKAPSELGRSVVDPLIKKAENAKSRITELYDVAKREGQMQEPVSVDSLVDYVNKNYPSARNAPIINTVGDELQRLGAAAVDDSGQLVATKQLSLNDMEEVRKLINKNYGSSATNDRFGGEAKSIIDQITEGKGGNLYQAARAARAKYAAEFENQGAISKLLGTKAGTTDRAVAYEDVWNKAVLNGSRDDLLNLRRSLMTGGAKGGDQAWRDIRAATVDYLKQEASKNMQVDELGNRVVSPAGLSNAMKSIGPEKLDVLFGKEAADKLRNLQSVVETLKIAPPGSVNTSGTSSAILNAFDRILNMLPVGGNLAKGAVNMARRAADEGAAAAKVNEALNPIEIIGQSAAAEAQKRASQKALDDLRLGRLAGVPAGDAGRKRR